MLKRLFSLLVMGCLAYTGAQAQSLMHAAGATVSIMTSKFESSFYSENFIITRSDLTYFPRFNFIEGENSSVSVGIPFSAGLSLARNTFDNESGLYWGLDFPLVVDYNLGFKSTPESPSTFGGYFGAGFGYSLTSIKFDNESANANSYGPLFRGGARFGFPSQDTDIGITVGLFYKIGLEEEKFKTFGFNVLIDF